MSDTQKIVDTLNRAVRHAESAMGELQPLPLAERMAIVAAGDMMLAASRILERRIAAHSNALEVQS